MKAFILAGGFATRLWPLTEKRAKPLLPLAGKLLLDHILEKIPGDIPVTVSTNAVFQKRFEKWHRDSGRNNIEILIEDTTHDDHKLGALGAVSQWITDADIEDDVLLLTGDNYFGFSIGSFLDSTDRKNPTIAAHDVKDLERAKSFGTVILNADNKTVASFEEKPKEPKSTLVSTGCSFLPASSLPILTEFAKEHPDNIGGIFEELLRKYFTIDCFCFSDPWFDIGSFDAYLEATKELVGRETLMEDDASQQDSTLEGSVVIGKGSKVSSSTLSDTVLFENCTVEDCVLTRCIVDNDCQLRGIDLTGKMLREGTSLSKN